ncbi:DUF58 domain-containing protein [Rhodocyclus tenuis]|uniref:DUF58 domain-containing protein n=1 Tax=Rhodocyclus tenuis TaxID=1066 RepID=UPI001903ECBD|nr:DUF58 domain-containing protein [Rhodocyclus tenuis]
MWLAAALALIATGINYGNNLVFALAFMLLAIWLQSAWLCWRNVSGLVWQPGVPMPVFAGEAVRIEGRLRENSGRQRFALELATDAASGERSGFASDSDATLALALPTQRRGLLTIERLLLQSRYPLGLWQCRRQLPGLQALVYPGPAGEARLPVASPLPAHRQTAADDFQGVRAYAPGDSPRRINWRAFGRSEQLLVNRFDGGRGGAALWLDWESCAGEGERRLGQLTRWVIEAEREGREYGLRLPGGALPPGRGRAQREATLARLALFEGIGGVEMA